MNEIIQEDCCDTKPTTEVKGEQEEEEVRLLRCGMTCGLAVTGEGAMVGEEEMARWLEEVWFRHVPQSNFLLADSYHVHTAQHTQTRLLEVSQDQAGHAGQSWFDLFVFVFKMLSCCVWPQQLLSAFLLKLSFHPL